MDCSLPLLRLLRQPNKKEYTLLTIGPLIEEARSVVYEDDNINLSHLLSLKDTIFGYSFTYKGKPTILKRPLILFIHYDQSEEKKELPLDIIYKDKHVQLIQRKKIAYAFSLKWTRTWLEDEENENDIIINENDNQ